MNFIQFSGETAAVTCLNGADGGMGRIEGEGRVWEGSTGLKICAA